jgi:hydroxymethylpyrimidine pyrophosphatase-like HAD family hydrolase
MNSAARERGNSMLVMDLDGTLLDSRQQLSARNRKMLERLGEQGIVRVVATGRSLFAARRAIRDDFPIELVHDHRMTGPDIERSLQLLLALGKDFMVQGWVPDTHEFAFHAASKRANPDFEKRLDRYRANARPLALDATESLPCSHIVVIEPHDPFDDSSDYDAIRAALAPLHVVRTTSPLDHRSRWIEIYPEGVGKSFAAERLRHHYGISRQSVYAVGNDFNDEDLLDWSKHAFVVANAHTELHARFTVVPSNEDHGVAAVIERLLSDLRSDT